MTNLSEITGPIIAKRATEKFVADTQNLENVLRLKGISMEDDTPKLVKQRNFINIELSPELEEKARSKAKSEGYASLQEKIRAMVIHDLQINSEHIPFRPTYFHGRLIIPQDTYRGLYEQTKDITSQPTQPHSAAEEPDLHPDSAEK